MKPNWIKDAVKKPGALRQTLGVKAGETIPASRLAKAAAKPGKTGQRARLAKTFRGMKRKKKYPKPRMAASPCSGPTVTPPM